MTEDALRADLLDLFASGPQATLSDSRFDALARGVFEAQYGADPVYRAYCDRRGGTPITVDSWRTIPPVPARAFKDLTFASGPRGERSGTFRTSGTSAGQSRRGTHHVPDLALYDASARAGFRAFVLPDLDRCRLFSLIPPPSDAPDSSLSHMAGVVMEAFGGDGSGWFLDPEVGVDGERLWASLETAVEEDTPVVLVGTSLAFAAWLADDGARGRRVSTPEGSRLMDTGGSKGRTRSLTADQLRKTYGDRLGIPPHRCVNEYGMTELCSQYYDVCLVRGQREPGDPKGARPWLRSLAADPDTLAPLPDGQTGVLRHVDLANRGSIIAVQTEDLGSVANGEVRLLGRAEGAEPRGCSLAMEWLLSSGRS